jgi:hypothetical protein
MSYQATNGDGGGGIAKGVSALANAIGLIVSIFATPAIFNAIKPWLYGHLLQAWGDGVAGLLLWVVAGAGAYAIYKLASLGITVFSIWAMTAYAAKTFKGD